MHEPGHVVLQTPVLVPHPFVRPRARQPGREKSEQKLDAVRRPERLRPLRAVVGRLEPHEHVHPDLFVAPEQAQLGFSVVDPAGEHPRERVEEPQNQVPLPHLQPLLHLAQLK